MMRAYTTKVGPTGQNAASRSGMLSLTTLINRSDSEKKSGAGHSNQRRSYMVAAPTATVDGHAVRVPLPKCRSQTDPQDRHLDKLRVTVVFVFASVGMFDNTTLYGVLS